MVVSPSALKLNGKKHVVRSAASPFALGAFIDCSETIMLLRDKNIEHDMTAGPSWSDYQQRI